MLPVETEPTDKILNPKKLKFSETSTQSNQSSLQSSISSPKKKKNEKKKSIKKETVEIHNWGGESVWDLLSDIDDSSTSKSLPSSSSKTLTSSSSTKSTTAPSPLRSPEKKDVLKKPTKQLRSGKKSKGLSSDEYITSENDSVYSDESPPRKSRDGKKNKEEIPVYIAKTLNSCIDELTDSITQNDGLEDIDMDMNIPNGYSAGDSEQEQYGAQQKNRHVNGNYIPSLQLRNLSESEEQSCEYNGQDQLEDARQMSWRSSVSSGGQSSRSTSETRDASMQTDSPFMSLPIRSPMSTQTESGSRHSLSASPISVWNSVDKCIKSPKGHSDGGKEKSPGGKKMVKTKQCKLSDLSHTTPDTWSADITDVPPNFDANVDMESGSESDGDAVIVETETCSPATPSTSDHFFESGYMVLQEPPSGKQIPVKYEVTLKPEETNIHYNVEKTEYKTYGLHSPGRETENIPESININITDNTSNVSENRYETITRQQFQLNQATDETPSGNIISERTFRASSELSSDRSDSNLEIRSERSNVDTDEQNFVETTVQNFPINPIDNDRLIGKEEDMFSPRESDTTSDYGTMIYDRRRGVSAAYDSDDIDSLASYGKYFTGSQENTPRGNITKLESDQTESGSFHEGENEPQNLEQTSNMTPRSFISEDQKLSVESINASRDTSRSSDDVYVSAEMSRTSSMSSEYKTPQQSPREGDEINDLSCENIQIPDISDSSKALINEKLKEEIKMQKTVSVNTEQLKEREQVIRETLKNELQKKQHYAEIKANYPDFSTVYTDGSKNGDRVASAADFRDRAATLRLPSNASIFTAEAEWFQHSRKAVQAHIAQGKTPEVKQASAPTPTAPVSDTPSVHGVGSSKSAIDTRVSRMEQQLRQQREEQQQSMQQMQSLLSSMATLTEEMRQSNRSSGTSPSRYYRSDNTSRGRGQGRRGGYNNRAGKRRTQTPDGACFYCHKQVHFKRDCRKLNNSPGSKPSTQNKQTERKSVTMNVPEDQVTERPSNGFTVVGTIGTAQL
ncbi:uncharacterized protein [Mytilus edulis]|uniref:uncharacterized protein n=1 Tax=Mytilus edulis TaxID=6550 RepID=UPI0039F02865